MRSSIAYSRFLVNLLLFLFFCCSIQWKSNEKLTISCCCRTRICILYINSAAANDVRCIFEMKKTNRIPCTNWLNDNKRLCEIKTKDWKKNKSIRFVAISICVNFYFEIVFIIDFALITHWCFDDYLHQKTWNTRWMHSRRTQYLFETKSPNSEMGKGVDFGTIVWKNHSELSVNIIYHHHSSSFIIIHRWIGNILLINHRMSAARMRMARLKIKTSSISILIRK